MGRTAEWDVDGLAVSCEGCINHDRYSDRCEDCEDFREKFLAEYAVEQAARYSDNTGTTGAESQEQRAEWLRLK